METYTSISVQQLLQILRPVHLSVSLSRVAVEEAVADILHPSILFSRLIRKEDMAEVEQLQTPVVEELHLSDLNARRKKRFAGHVLLAMARERMRRMAVPFLSEPQSTKSDVTSADMNIGTLRHIHILVAQPATEKDILRNGCNLTETMLSGNLLPTSPASVSHPSFPHITISYRPPLVAVFFA